MGGDSTHQPSPSDSSEQQYALRWNDFHSSILSSFRHLRDEEDFVDVTLACDGGSFSAHKVVLSACSPYFRRLLKANPCQHPIVILRDVQHKDMESLLRFMYNGEVHIGQEQLSDFLKTAQMLQVRGLADVPAGSAIAAQKLITTAPDQKVSPNSTSLPWATDRPDPLRNDSTHSSTGGGALSSPPPAKRSRSTEHQRRAYTPDSRMEQLMAAASTLHSGGGVLNNNNTINDNRRRRRSTSRDNCEVPESLLGQALEGGPTIHTNSDRKSSSDITHTSALPYHHRSAASVGTGEDDDSDGSDAGISDDEVNDTATQHTDDDMMSLRNDLHHIPSNHPQQHRVNISSRLHRSNSGAGTGLVTPKTENTEYGGSGGMHQMLMDEHNMYNTSNGGLLEQSRNAAASFPGALLGLQGLPGLLPGPSGMHGGVDSFANRRSLDMMRVRATDPRPCPKCGKIYRSAHTLRTHLEDKHTICPGYRCVLCGTVAKSRNSLHSHMSRQHRGISTKDLPVVPMPAPFDPDLASRYRRKLLAKAGVKISPAELRARASPTGQRRSDVKLDAKSSVYAASEAGSSICGDNDPEDLTVTHHLQLQQQRVYGGFEFGSGVGGTGMSPPLNHQHHQQHNHHGGLQQHSLRRNSSASNQAIAAKSLDSLPHNLSKEPYPAPLPPPVSSHTTGSAILDTYLQLITDNTGMMGMMSDQATAAAAVHAAKLAQLNSLGSLDKAQQHAFLEKMQQQMGAVANDYLLKAQQQHQQQQHQQQQQQHMQAAVAAQAEIMRSSADTLHDNDLSMIDPSRRDEPKDAGVESSAGEEEEDDEYMSDEEERRARGAGGDASVEVIGAGEPQQGEQVKVTE